MKRAVNSMSFISISRYNGGPLLKAELAEIKVAQGKFGRYMVADGSRVWPFGGPLAAEEGCVTETGA